jgi:hypothetical protein
MEYFITSDQLQYSLVYRIWLDVRSNPATSFPPGPISFADPLSIDPEAIKLGMQSTVSLSTCTFILLTRQKTGLDMASVVEAVFLTWWNFTPLRDLRCHMTPFRLMEFLWQTSRLVPKSKVSSSAKRIYLFCEWASYRGTCLWANRPKLSWGTSLKHCQISFIFHFPSPQLTFEIFRAGIEQSEDMKRFLWYELSLHYKVNKNISQRLNTGTITLRP